MYKISPSHIHPQLARWIRRQTGITIQANRFVEMSFYLRNEQTLGEERMKLVS